MNCRICGRPVSENEARKEYPMCSACKLEDKRNEQPATRRNEKWNGRYVP